MKYLLKVIVVNDHIIFSFPMLLHFEIQLKMKILTVFSKKSAFTKKWKVPFNSKVSEKEHLPNSSSFISKKYFRKLLLWICEQPHMKNVPYTT